MALKTENFSYLLDKNIRKIFVQEYKNVPSPISTLYDVMKSELYQEEVAGLSDYPAVEEFVDKITYKDTNQEFKTTVSHTEYAAGIQIRRRIIDDDQFNQIMRMPKQLGRAMAYRRQQDGATIFNDAFTSSVTYGDSKSLCHAAHNTEAGSTTWSNTGTTALSPAALTATRLLMRKFTSPNDKIISNIPNLVLVPIDKEDRIIEILKTTGEVDTANNNLNINKGRFTYIAWDFLSSTTAWFMISKALMRDSLVWYNRKPTEFNKDVDTDTLVKKWSTYMRYSQTTSDFRWIYGQNATS